MTTMSGRQSIAAVACPHCSYGYSRAVHAQAVDGRYRRRRVCVSNTCGRGFITYEVVAREYKRSEDEEVEAHQGEVRAHKEARA